MPDEQIVRGNDARIMRGTEDGDDFGVMADDEDCRVMGDVVRFRAVMRVAFDDDSKRRRQGFDRVVRAGDAFEGGIEVVEVTAYSLRRIAPGIERPRKPRRPGPGVRPYRDGGITTASSRAPSARPKGYRLRTRTDPSQGNHCPLGRHSTQPRSR